MKAIHLLAAAAGSWFGLAAHAQVASFDPASLLVNIPSVSVGSSTFRQVSLRLRSDSTFELVGAVEQKPATPGVASYDVATSTLTLPAVRVGDSTFLDVKLLNTGNFVFSLQSIQPVPADVQAAADGLKTLLESLFATRVPATGAERFAQTDSCWRNNGRTRANAIADWDAETRNYQQRDAFQIGRKVRNMQVLAVRDSRNPDGSSRREVSLQYEVVYRDGVVITDNSTLVSGSTAGTPGCATAQTGSDYRLLGNQQLVGVDVRAQNMRDERYSIDTGAALSPAVTYRREVQFAITDPMGNATYVIVTGPGPSTVINAVTWPFSLKFLSPRLLRSAPELVGKPGNFLNWLDTDSFRNCRLPSGALPVVHIVNCVADGATANSWGIGFTQTPDAAADAQFAAQGWVAGGVYRFDVYNDDGWKAVNGHASRMPIATYYATLERLPYTFVEMAGRYPVIQLGAVTTAQIAGNATLTTPFPLTMSWTRPSIPPGGAPMHLFQAWEFHQGAGIGNSGGAFYPAYRTLSTFYPGTTSIATTSFPAAPKPSNQLSKTYIEYNLYFSEGGGNHSIQSRLSFQ